MDEGEARRLLDERLERAGADPTTPDEWRRLLAIPALRERVSYSPTPEGDFAGEAELYIRFARGGSPPRRRRRGVDYHADSPAPPDWWEAESRRRLAEFREDRVWARVDAGLFKVVGDDDDLLTIVRAGAPDEAIEGRKPYLPLGSVAEIAPLIRGLITEQHRRFRAATEAPAWGWDPDDFLDYVEEIEFPAVTWEKDRQTERESFLPGGFAAMGSATDAPSLDRLHNRTRWMAEELGISQAECLVWALSDFPLTIPWLRATVRERESASQSTITIHANTIAASAEDVRRVFARTLRSVGRRGGMRTRAPRAWPAIAAAFAEERRAQTPVPTWHQLYADFCAQYGNHYASMRAFREACYRYPRAEKR